MWPAAQRSPADRAGNAVYGQFVDALKLPECLFGQGAKLAVDFPGVKAFGGQCCLQRCNGLAFGAVAQFPGKVAQADGRRRRVGPGNQRSRAGVIEVPGLACEALRWRAKYRRPRKCIQETLQGGRSSGVLGIFFATPDRQDRVFQTEAFMCGQCLFDFLRIGGAIPELFKVNLRKGDIGFAIEQLPGYLAVKPWVAKGRIPEELAGRSFA
ncbi:hypothetical protein D3C77_410130 [compost metagenome]